MGFSSGDIDKVVEKKAAYKRPTDLRMVVSLVKDLIRNKPRPVPMRKIVDEAKGKAVFRGSSQLPFLQTRHAMAERGIPEKAVRVHVSPSAGVVSEYGGVYLKDNPSPGANRRSGFLQVIQSSLGNVKSGKQPFTHDFGAEKLTGLLPAGADRDHAKISNAYAMRHPYEFKANGAFEAILPSKSLADAKVYAVSVLPGHRSAVRAPDYDHIMLTDITRINRLAKIRDRHPEFAHIIDPVIYKYTKRRIANADTYHEIGTYRRGGASLFKNPPAWQLPRRLRNSEFYQD